MWFLQSAAVAVPLQGVPGTKQERTFIAVKPDGMLATPLFLTVANIIYLW